MVSSNDPELNIDSPTHHASTSPSTFSPTALQVTTTSAFAGPETIDTTTGKVTPPRTATPLTSPLSSPIATTPLGHALSQLSQRVMNATSPNSNCDKSYCGSVVSSPKQTAIYESDLIAYSDYQASKLAYPVGCPVWYTYNSTEYDVDHKPKLSQVRIGKVQSVAMNVVTRSFVYKISKSTLPSSASYDEKALDLVLEDHIAYATSCPVRVTIEDRIMDGEIISVSNLQDFSGATKSYSVMLSERGNVLRVEHEVEGERIKYRPDAEDNVGVVARGAEDGVCNSPFTCW